jgi:peptidoglycan/xylan/chitin deacetylase (PgdA/CDA1 family)
MKSNNLVILVYHGVTDKVNSGIENFSSKHLHFQDFEDQMKLLKNKYLVLSMDDVYKIYNENLIIPENSVAITFDDGFKNNISIAAPILDKLQLPATFYFSTGLINTNSLFWVDLIEDIIIKCELNEISIQLESLEKFIFNSNQSKIDAIIEIKRYCKKVKKSIKDKIIKQLILITNYHNIESLINSN